MASLIQRSVFLFTLLVPCTLSFAQDAPNSEPPKDMLIPIPEGLDVSKKGMPEIRTDCRDAEAFGGTRIERGAWCLLKAKKYVGARTLAESSLIEDEDSFRAHYLLGTALHLGDGNLPKALFHLSKSESLFIGDHGIRPLLTGKAPIVPYHRVLIELIYVHGEMDHHEEKIRYVDDLKYRLADDLSPLKAWPLLKLKRFDEAQRIAEEAVQKFGKENPYWRAVGLTALCAIHSEKRDRESAYEACMGAAAPVMNVTSEGGVALSNAAAASIEVFKFDQAERLYNEATKRNIEGTINPWGRLTHLYLRQGRFAEAVAALREMQMYRRRRPAYFDQQDQTDAELTGAAVLMIAGRMKETMRITGRTVDRPDRQGTSSAASEQNEAGNLLMDVVARRDMAQRLREEASWSSFGDRVQLYFSSLKLDFQAWLRQRKASTLLSDPERLSTSLRPECPGSIEMPSWLNGEVVATVGPGVALATIASERETETLPMRFADPVFSTFEAEAFLLKRDYESALETANKALSGLPESDVLPRARMAMIAAESAKYLGKREEVIQHLEQVLIRDPGLVRRMGFRLPVAPVASGFGAPDERWLIDIIENSPLLEVVPWGFRLDLSPDSVHLGLPDGTRLLQARVPKSKNPDQEFQLRQVARTAHFELLVPNVDVTQSDIRSLDGGVLGGGRASDKVKSILKDLMNPPPVNRPQ